MAGREVHRHAAVVGVGIVDANIRLPVTPGNLRDPRLAASL